MTPDATPAPAAPTPLTPSQAAAIHGASALRQFPGEDRAPAFEPALLAAALLVADHESLPVPPPTVLADIAAVRSGIHPSYEWSQP